MLPHYLAVRPAARRIAKVLNDSVTALRDGRVKQEPAMTDRMLGALAEPSIGRTPAELKMSPCR